MATNLDRTPAQQLMALKRAYGEHFTFRHGFRYDRMTDRVHYFTLYVRLARTPAWTGFSAEGQDAVAVVDIAYRYLLGDRP